ncbi:hypothetical protein NLG97_g335 [Lecanicillium saksenae]|uniref:Uncharacterized protein n=1 Tax=Lecanicillium saksenae TaxID=468837 RepID=A0ACC1RB15_9HYPO|nr:hypothetical protein NLG97_g335 [Lecanicillium saksenae]
MANCLGNKIRTRLQDLEQRLQNHPPSTRHSRETTEPQLQSMMNGHEARRSSASRDDDSLPRTASNFSDTWFVSSSDISEDRRQSRGNTFHQLHLEEPSDCVSYSAKAVSHEMKTGSSETPNRRTAGDIMQKGADVRRQNDQGQSSLHMAAISGKEDVVKILIENHLDPDQADVNGNTALHYGVEGNHGRIVSILLEKGASSSIRNAQGQTALHLAARSGYDEIAADIAQHSSASVQLENSTGRTAMTIAIEMGHAAVARALLRHGADPNATVRI